MEKHKTAKLLLIFLVAWLSTTLMVDFMVIPGAFRVLQDLAQSSRLGLFIFSSYNKVELLLSLAALVCAGALYKKGRAYALPIITSILLVITLSYLFILTPNIAHLREQRLAVQESNPALAQELKKELMFYHRLYVGIDSGKMLLLLAGSGLSFFYRPRQKKIFGKSAL